MEDAGQKLKRVRERLNLRYRDVEEASLRIATRHNSDEFSIALSRLADIENKGVVPSLYRLYSLCAIYRLDIAEVLLWYEVDLAQLAADAALVDIDKTHLIGFPSGVNGEIQFPLSLDPGIDLRKTTYLSRMIQRWGKLPLMLLNGLDLRNHRYGFLGLEDWTMYPVLPPGSLVVIDEERRKIQLNGWTNEWERPIYFFEHREGFWCGWCSQTDDQVILQPHPASNAPARVFPAGEIDVVGQVTAVAARLDLERRRRARTPADAAVR
jgi:transcriptional regulator with XRE-family HTH domain